MATKADPSEQVKFLVSCIRHTTNGRPDFAAVALELGIVSKAAAQKRYERMLKAHNVSATNPPSPADSDTTTKKTPAKKRGVGAAVSRETPTKKRARVSKAVKKESEDEGDAKASNIPKSNPKNLSKDEKNTKAAKEEEDKDSPLSEVSSTLQDEIEI